MDDWPYFYITSYYFRKYNESRVEALPLSNENFQ